MNRKTIALALGAGVVGGAAVLAAALALLALAIDEESYT